MNNKGFFVISMILALLLCDSYSLVTVQAYDDVIIDSIEENAGEIIEDVTDDMITEDGTGDITENVIEDIITEDGTRNTSYDIPGDITEDTPEDIIEEPFEEIIEPVASGAVEYTVSFNSAGGSSVSSQKVPEGGKATKPDDPTRSGYIFADWLLNNAKYDFNTTVSANIELTASWNEVSTTDPTSTPTPDPVKPEYTVSFNSAGGSSVSSQKVPEGGKATKPDDPTRSGYTFADWFFNNAKYDFNTTVSANIELTASWNEIPTTDPTPDPPKVKYTVSFNSSGGSEVAPQQVEENKTAREPDDPVKEGYVFGGWYLDGTKYDFTTPVSANILLTADWRTREILSSNEINEDYGHIVWSLDNGGLLTVSGNGDFSDIISANRVPWHTLSSNILSAKIDVKNMTDASYMFADCVNLKRVDMSGFDAASMNRAVDIFRNCDSLATINTPVNLSGMFIMLPGAAGDIWYMPDGTETTKLPTGLSTSIVLKKNDNPVTEDPYVCGTPTFSPPSGTKIKKSTPIVISTSTLGAKIYYTTDNTIPSEKNGYLYSLPITVSSNIIIHAIAVREGYKNSPVVSANYIVTDSDKPDEPDNPDNPDKPDEPDNPDYPSSDPVWGEILPQDRPAKPSDIPSGLWIAGVMDSGYVYTGSQIRPAFRVYDNKKLFIEGVSYTVSYKNNIKAKNASAMGAPSIVVTGKGNYSGTLTKTFTIAPRRIDDKAIERTFTNAYSAAASNPALKFSAKYAGKALKNNTDYIYTVENSNGSSEVNWSNPGTYTFHVIGKGNFTGDLLLDFEVTNKVPVSKFKISAISNQKYTGKEIEPKITAKYNKVTLREGTDYMLSYADNINSGTGIVIVTGSGNYAGSRNVKFNITGTPIKKAALTGYKSSLIYNGSAQKQPARLTYQGMALTENKDYTASYSNNRNKGKATVIYRGIGGYSGTLKKTFRITACNMNDVNIAIEPIENVKYIKGGNKPEPKVTYTNADGQTVTLVKGRDYTLSYKNNKNVAMAASSKPPMVIVKGKGNFTGSRSAKFTIERQHIAQMTISVPDVVYSPKKTNYRSAVTIYDLDGKALKAGKDYNKNILYTFADGSPLGSVVPNSESIIIVKAEAAGRNYEGTITGAYRIVRSGISKAKVTVRNPEKSNKNLFDYTGHPVTVSKNNITVQVGSYTLSDSEFDILESTYKNNINKGTASVMIRGRGNYGGLKTVKFKIGKRGLSSILTK